MKTYLSILMALALFALNAQNNNTMENKKYVEVTGIAEQLITPNEIYIAITLQEEKEGRKRSVEDQEKVLISTLKKLDVDVKNLRLSDVGSFTRWDKKTKESFKQKSFELKLENATTASKVQYELNQLDIYRMYVSRTDHSNIEQIRKDVKIEAVKAAKDKAQYLLSAVNEQLGDVLYIIEQDYGYQPMYKAMGASNIAYDGGYEPNPEVEFEKIKVQYKILARFEIQ